MPATAKVVWILGAGFSRSLGAPLLDGLFRLESCDKVAQTFSKLIATTEHIKNGPAKYIRNVVKFYLAGAYGPKNNAFFYAPHWEHAEEFIERLERACSIDSAEDDHLRALAGALDGMHVPGSRETIVTKCFIDKPGGIPRARDTAIWLLAAECCAFLENANTNLERWMPYTRWADLLRSHDAIITFNYDQVPNLLSKHIAKKPPKEYANKHGFWIPLPSEVNVERSSDEMLKPAVLKLHGSIDWWIDVDTVMQAPADRAHCGALIAEFKQQALATPGPRKRDLVHDGGPLSSLWDYAGRAIDGADAIVFVGYRIPPTDSYTRHWLLEHLAKNCGTRRENRIYGRTPAEPLMVHTVLGSDTRAADSLRLTGMLEAAGDPMIQITPWPMWAEDFLAVVKPLTLMKS